MNLRLLHQNKALRLLHQNKAPFNLDQLSKFRRIARKSVPMIRALSSRIEGTIVTIRLR